MHIQFCLKLQDDNRDQCLKLEDILPNEPVQPISYDTLLILLGMKTKNNFYEIIIIQENVTYLSNSYAFSYKKL